MTQLMVVYRFNTMCVHMCRDLWVLVYVGEYVRGAYDKFQDFFRLGTFIDSTHMKF